MGLALVELGKNEKGTISIKKGISFLIQGNNCHSILLNNLKASENYSIHHIQDEQIKDELRIKVKKSNKILWMKEREEKLIQITEMKSFINDLIKKDDISVNEQKLEHLTCLNEMMEEKSSSNCNNFEVPEYMCCKITFVNLATHIISRLKLSIGVDERTNNNSRWYML